MDRTFTAALGELNVTSLNYSEWIAVGMALKAEGYDCSVWDEWSRNDPRYKAGECARKWDTFNGTANPVTGATIVQMAKDRGWKPADAFTGVNGIIGWDDPIGYLGREGQRDAWDPVADLTAYIEALFKPEDHVGYVTDDVWQNDKGEWSPGRGTYAHTAGELLASLKRYPNDLGATVGDWNPECGAWIRFNALDGNGVKNENVTSFRFALVESDSMTIDEQSAVFRKLQLPIAALVHSGGRSLHAIVHIDAEDATEYRQRVDFLYAFLESNGVTVDKQNRNPSRLSRLPGATRNGQRQRLIATNIGCASWDAWKDFADGTQDDLPDFEGLDAALAHKPALPDELIKGILRCGHKMLISGSSKAGKSFLLMELAIAITEGRKWLGFQCRKGRVLYVNLEIDRASCIDRFARIYESLEFRPKHSGDLVLWNLRGHAVPLDRLVPKLIRRMQSAHYDAVIIDPIYKVITGDENSASDMGAFCNEFDKICTATGCAAIYCHHHSKGAQGNKDAKDRASGSGVFARDPDAQLDMIEVQLEKETIESFADCPMTAWRLESSLREFPNIKPLNFWFSYPVHELDEEDSLSELPAVGTKAADRLVNPKQNPMEKKLDDFRRAYEILNMEGNGVDVAEMASYLGIAERTVRDHLKKLSGEFKLYQGKVIALRND